MRLEGTACREARKAAWEPQFCWTPTGFASAAAADLSVPTSGSCGGELRRRKGAELEKGESDPAYAIKGGSTAA